MKILNFLSLASSVLFCIGCSEVENSKDEKISMVADLALKYAKKDSINLEEYSLQSVRLLRNGRQSAVHESTRTDYFSSAIKRLNNKKYWEACYRVSNDLALGSIYCYYFEDPNLNYLATYKVK